MGKATTIYAVNGTEILLPCTFSSCFGFENLHFWWSYNSSDTYKIVSSRRRDGQLRSSSGVCPLTLPPTPGCGPFWTHPRDDGDDGPQGCIFCHTHLSFILKNVFVSFRLPWVFDVFFSCSHWRLPFSCGALASQCSGCSGCGAGAPGHMGSVAVVPGLVAPWHVGSSRTRDRNFGPCIGRWILN